MTMTMGRQEDDYGHSLWRHLSQVQGNKDLQCWTIYLRTKKVQLLWYIHLLGWALLPMLRIQIENEPTPWKVQGKILGTIVSKKKQRFKERNERRRSEEGEGGIGKACLVEEYVTGTGQSGR